MWPDLAPIRPTRDRAPRTVLSDLKAIVDRLTAASPGPWQRHGSDVYGEYGRLFIGRDGAADVRAQADRDAEFVAHAREDIAALLCEIARLREATQESPHPGRTLSGTAGATEWPRAVRPRLARTTGGVARQRVEPDPPTTRRRAGLRCRTRGKIRPESPTSPHSDTCAPGAQRRTNPIRVERTE